MLGPFGGQQLGDLIGQIVAGRYEVVALIGQGGMGAVYELRHRTLNRRFALKTLRAEMTNDAEALARLQREAGIIASLRHPHIVDIVDWDVSPGGAPFMVMEYLAGEDLGARLARTGAMDWRMLARIADQALSALAFAHREGVIHRDLKPGNIFLAHGDTDVEQVKLLDFGLSKFHDAAGLEVTTEARVLGTPAYMAPEQADGRIEDMSPATDVWSMGVMLYRMATGEIPFSGHSIPSMLYKVCHGQARPLLELRPDAPRAFADIVHAAISRGEDRITSAGALRRGLRAALEAKADDTTPFLPLSSAVRTGVYESETSIYDPEASIHTTPSSELPDDSLPETSRFETLSGGADLRATHLGTPPPGPSHAPAVDITPLPRRVTPQRTEASPPVIAKPVGESSTTGAKRGRWVKPMLGAGVVAMVAVIAMAVVTFGNPVPADDSPAEPAATEPTPAETYRPAATNAGAPIRMSGDQASPTPVPDAQTAGAREPAANASDDAVAQTGDPDDGTDTGDPTAARKAPADADSEGTPAEPQRASKQAEPDRQRKHAKPQHERRQAEPEPDRQRKQAEPEPDIEPEHARPAAADGERKRTKRRAKTTERDNPDAPADPFAD